MINDIIINNNNNSTSSSRGGRGGPVLSGPAVAAEGCGAGKGCPLLVHLAPAGGHRGIPAGAVCWGGRSASLRGRERAAPQPVSRRCQLRTAPRGLPDVRAARPGAKARKAANPLGASGTICHTKGLFLAKRRRLLLRGN